MSVQPSKAQEVSVLLHEFLSSLNVFVFLSIPYGIVFTFFVSFKPFLPFFVSLMADCSAVPAYIKTPYKQRVLGAN